MKSQIFILSQPVELEGEGYWPEAHVVKEQRPSMSSDIGNSQVMQSWKVPNIKKLKIKRSLRSTCGIVIFSFGLLNQGDDYLGPAFFFGCPL